MMTMKTHSWRIQGTKRIHRFWEYVNVSEPRQIVPLKPRLNAEHESVLDTRSTCKWEFERQ